MKERIIQEIEKTQKRNEEMLKALVPCWTEIDHNRGYIEGLRFDLEVIEMKEPRWIPVSERLPKKCEYGEVLVTYIPSGGTLWTTVIIAHYSDLMGIAKPSFHIGEVGKESFQNITKQVIAWMPLPEPYTEVGNG